jgi:LIVCS family branched-chain amino acid:cation transporter
MRVGAYREFLMRIALPSSVVITGFAIFSMFFGAGDLIFPIKVGMTSGTHLIPAILGFLLTAVLMPLIAIAAMMLFDGDYHQFFERIGVLPGRFLILLCMFIIGPLIGITRTVQLSYDMLQVFVPALDVVLYSCLFMGVAVLCVLKDDFIIPLLGYCLAPLLLTSVGIIIAKGVLVPGVVNASAIAPWRVFVTNVKYGFSTLDVIAALFFGALVLAILRHTMKYVPPAHVNNFALSCMRAGAIGSVLMGILYTGLIYLGSVHSAVLSSVSESTLFSNLAHIIMGQEGQLVIMLAIITACLTTALALLAVVAQYLNNYIFCNYIGYIPSLLIVALMSLGACFVNLDTIMRATYGPVAMVLYPVIITIIFCNCAYKLFGMRTIKIPVLITFVLSVGVYISKLLNLF